MKRYPTLHRNLQDLEFKIKSIFEEADNEEHSRQLFLNLSEGIEHKIVFLKSHIAAEENSANPDHHLIHLDHRLDNLRSNFTLLKNNLVDGEPLGLPEFDGRSSCSCSDESTCLHGDEDDDEREGDDEDEKKDDDDGAFKVYNNPLAFDDDDGVSNMKLINNVGVNEEKLEEGYECDGKWWPHLRGMAVGVVAGGVIVAATMVSLILRYGVQCRFVVISTTGFPPPT